MKKTLAAISTVLLLATGAASVEEGTRHITGSGVDLYFMNDKLFGTAGGHPLWAIYNCGSDINGVIDAGGAYHRFAFTYHAGAEPLITGDFGSLKMAMRNIEKSADGFLYRILTGETEHQFSIRYQRVEGDHLVNSIVEGQLKNRSPVRLTVQGRLCPFATTGIIMIVSGAAALQ